MGKALVDLVTHARKHAFVIFVAPHIHHKLSRTNKYMHVVETSTAIVPITNS
jgi:hypothetical protein